MVMPVLAWRLSCGIHRVTTPLPSSRQQLHVAAAGKRQIKKKREPKNVSGTKPLDPRDLYELELEEQGGEVVLPKAPPPKDFRNPRPVDSSPGDYYPVFAPEPGSIKQVRGGPWRWDEEDEEEDTDSSSQPPMRWNPRTGFMLQEAPEAMPGGTSAQALGTEDGSGGGHAGSDVQGSARGGEASTSGRRQEQGDLRVDLTLPSPVTTAAVDERAAGLELPAVGKGQILASCAGTSFSMALLAVLLRTFSQTQAVAVMGTDPAVLDRLLAVPPGLASWQEAGVLLGAALVVTGARWGLMGVWPDLREATDRANRQVLTPLSWRDVALVAVLSGASEEFLFRGALIPASFPDWRGVLLSGIIFGGLHASGGRNLAFATWAAGVGCLYGSVYLATGNLWVAAGAHSLANFVSAVSWQSMNGGGGKGGAAVKSG